MSTTNAKIGKIWNCVKWNIQHIFYVLTFQKDALLTRYGVYYISPEAIRGLVIGLDTVSFTCSVRGREEDIIIQVKDVIGVTSVTNIP